MPGRFDVVSALLSLAAVLPVIYGVKKHAEDGVTPAAVLAIGVGLVCGVLFLRRQRRPDPMIDLSLFARRPFWVSITTNMLALFAVMGFGLVSAQFLQLVLGLRPMPAALWSIPMLVAMMIGTAAAVVGTRWARPAYVVGAGLVVATVGFLVLARLQVDSGVAAVVVGGGLMACGVGVVAALGTDLVLASAPPERAGEGSALSETGAELGGALGMAVLGSVGIAVYRAEIGRSMPAGLPPDAVVVVTDTLGGAAGVASAARAAGRYVAGRGARSVRRRAAGHGDRRCGRDGYGRGDGDDAAALGETG